MMYHQVCPQISKELLSLKEQLELFQASSDISDKNACRQDDDWDYATANTKTETHCFHTYPAMMIPQVARRLIEAFRKQQASGVDEIDSLMRLRALCREALRVLPDLAYYFRERERIQQFEDATRDAIDVETRRALANLIKDMMDSDEM